MFIDFDIKIAYANACQQNGCLTMCWFEQEIENRLRVSRLCFMPPMRLQMARSR